MNTASIYLPKCSDCPGFKKKVVNEWRGIVGHLVRAKEWWGVASHC